MLAAVTADTVQQVFIGVTGFQEVEQPDPFFGARNHIVPSNGKRWASCVFCHYQEQLGQL